MVVSIFTRLVAGLLLTSCVPPEPQTLSLSFLAHEMEQLCPHPPGHVVGDGQGC